MAARRIGKTSIDWAAFLERVPQNQRPQFMLFKAKSDGYLRKVHSLPENPPAIDFAAYKQRVPNAAFIDDFEKQMKALQIPYPKENLTPMIQAEEEKQKQMLKEFVAQSNAKISEAKSKFAEMEKQVPIEHMTMEDFFEAYPENAWNPEKPTYWPHTEEYQQPPDRPPYHPADH